MVTRTAPILPSAPSATLASHYRPPNAMKSHLSLRRLNGKRLASDRGEVRHRLVDFHLTRADGYRVARAQCCVGGSEVATLWEPTLIRVDATSLVFQGFEKTAEQTVVQEWIVEPYFAEARR